MNEAFFVVELHGQLLTVDNGKLTWVGARDERVVRFSRRVDAERVMVLVPRQHGMVPTVRGCLLQPEETKETQAP